MALDSLKSDVSDYKKDETELNKDRERFSLEIQKADSLSSFAAGMDSETAQAIEGVRQSLELEQRELEQREEELERVKDNISRKIGDEQRKLDTVQKKLDRLDGKKYTGGLDAASKKCDDLLAQLDDMLKDIGADTTDIAVGRGVDVSGDRMAGNDTDKQNYSIIEAERHIASLTSNKAKGNYGEMKVDQDMREKGYDRISKEMVTDLDGAGHQGIDGVYYNADGHPPYIISDAKYGTAVLIDTDDGKQMSWGWINKRLDAAVGKESADAIRMERLFHPDRVGCCVAHVDESGSVIYDLLDNRASVVEKDVKF